ncbi:MAG: iron chaperone [Candidatus Altimarinota bacterium]
MMRSLGKSVDEYIQNSPQEAQSILKKIRGIIKKSAPEAVESISYMMPAYKLHKKPLVYFGAMKTHLGFYATPTGNAAFTKQLEEYVTGKGSIQFPYDQPIPYDLIQQIVLFRVKEVEQKYGKKPKHPPSPSRRAKSTARAPKRKSPARRSD